MKHPNGDRRIAIVGVSAIMPKAEGVAEFWRAVVGGDDQFSDVPAGRWLVEDYYDPDPDAQNKTYARRGAFLSDIDFDPMAFGVPPRALPATDSAQLLALVAATRLFSSLEAAGLGRLDGERVGVFLGCASLALLGEMAAGTVRPIWRRALLDSGLPHDVAEAVCDRISEYSTPWQEGTFPGLLSNVVAGRIANRFGLHGANFTVDAACASSLAALSVAVDDLVMERSDLVLTGGVDTLTGPMAFMCFSKTLALSPSGECRPFDQQADGTMLGEGIALFALKRLRDAERDDDPVLAVIRGIGSSSDGAGTSIYAPLASGQARALRNAYSAAGYGPDTVTLLEAHGTGTVAGDSAEIAALRTVFDESGRSDRQWCALGSVKSQIGHTKAAAGAAGMLKAALALRHKVLPPTIKVDTPNPDLDLESSAFYLNTTARPWIHRADHPRRASVSSFGFGGSNFHVTLEEYRGREPARCVARPNELVVLSGASTDELFDFSIDGPLTSIARRSQETFRSTDAVRLAIVADSVEALEDKLDQARELAGSAPFATPTGIHYRTGGSQAGKIAFLFPGQGSQYVGMGSDLAIHFPGAHAVWDRYPAVAATVFARPSFSHDQRQADREALIDTRQAQPAIAVHSLALLSVLEAVGLRPDCVGGHSLGELIALHAARALSESSLVRLATRRGEAMGEATGVMLAVNADAERTADLLARREIDDVWIANHNAPSQVVLSATAEARQRFEEAALREEIGTRRLNTAAAFHSPLVSAAVDPVAEFLAGEPIRSPLLDVYSNATGAVHPVDPAAVRQAISEHIVSPVYFADMVGAMYADGVRTFVEVGPSAALTGLVDQILVDRPHHALATDRPGKPGVTELHVALAKLAVLGVPLMFSGLWAGHEPEVQEESVPLMPITINGGNYGRAYPGSDQIGPPAAGPPTVAEDAPAAPAESGPPTAAAVPSPPAPTALPAPAFGTAGPGLRTNEPLDALLAAQQETARAHAAYLSVAEKSIDAIMRLSGIGSGELDNTPDETPSLPWPTIAFAADDPPPAATPTGAAGDAPAPDGRDQAGPVTGPSGAEFRDPEPSSSDVPARRPARVGGPRTDEQDLEAIILSTVSEKTGYPIGTLDPQMDLEADLGLDSITRMQVLAALRASLPQLEVVDRAQLARLLTRSTVGEVAEQLRLLLAAATGLSANAGAATPPRPGLRRHRLELTPVTAPGRPMADFSQGAVVVTQDGTGVADAVIDVLAEHGVSAWIGEPDGSTCHVIDLAGLSHVASETEATEVQRGSLRTAKKVAARFGSQGGSFVTVQDTGGGFGHRNPQPGRCWIGGLAALTRTVRVEWPAAAVKALECPRDGRAPREIAEAVVTELMTGGRALEVALAADGTRWQLEPVELGEAEPNDPVAIRTRDGVIVVTGGGSAITAPAVRALAANLAGAHFVIVGRRSEAPALITDLDSAEYRPIDVRDHNAMSAMLQDVRLQRGPITGVIHAAGALADSRLEDKSVDEFDLVFGPKVDGFRALMAATREDPLELVYVFSSVVAATGSLGQADYAMANETLNQAVCAESLARPHARCCSLLWGPWEGGMVTPELAEVFRMSGVELIPIETGAQAFADEVRGGRGENQVILTAGNTLRQLWGDRVG